MYQGAHSGNNRPRKRVRYRVNKTLFLLLAVIMLIGVTAAATVAFLVTETDPVVNSFEYAKVSCAVSESFDGATKSNVQIQNTGSTDAYIRATYVVTWRDRSGNIAAAVPEGYSYSLVENPDGTWTKGYNGYFYYWTPVAPGASTAGSLLNCTVTCPENPEYTLSVEILATAIQSSPSGAVTEAWGTGPNAGN